MRIFTGGIGAMAVALWMVSCAGTGSAPNLGDIEAGDEPAQGGIAEVPNPSEEMAQKGGKSLAEIQSGHVVFMLHCGQCHTYKLPQDLDMDEWETTMPKMIGHAGLSSSDEQAVLAYVVSVKKLRGEE